MSQPKLSSLSVAEYNAQLRAITRRIAATARTEGAARSIGASPTSSGEGLRSIKPFTGKSDGEITRLGIRFKRHLIFVEHGVGRGRKTGDAPGQLISRRPRPHLSSGIDKHHKEVADVVAKFHAEDFIKMTDRALAQIDQGATSIRITKS